MKPTTKSLIKFLEKHPELRTWQAIYAWSKLPNIVVLDINGKATDVFYWKGRNK